MERQRPWFVAAVAGIVLGLAAVVAIGSGSRLGEGTSRSLASTFDVDPMQVLAWGFLGLLLILLVAAFTGRGGAQRQRRQRRNVSQTGVLLLLVVFSVIALTIASIGGDEQEQEAGALPGEGSLMTRPSEQVVGAATGLVAVALLGAAATALWLHASRRSIPDEVGPTTVERVIDDAILELEMGADPRRTIIQAYARLERSFESGGLARRPEEAPQEYVGRVLVSIDVDGEAVRRLTALYEEARYSAHVIERDLATDALDVLGRIRHGLRTP